MIGNLVVVKDTGWMCIGKVVIEDEETGKLGIVPRHVRMAEGKVYSVLIYWIAKEQIIKKSLRPIGMEPQISNKYF